MPLSTSQALSRRAPHQPSFGRSHPPVRRHAQPGNQHEAERQRCQERLRVPGRAGLLSVRALHAAPPAAKS
eukprot:scaffold5720_cov127-Isochrysis_galbana.AAC.10